MSHERVIAIIPARRDSKGIPGKNLRCLAGKPLLAHTLNSATQCKSIDEVVVTTEDAEIAQLADSWRVRVIHRPSVLALDDTSMEAVVEHALSSVATPGHICLLQPTSPLRTGDDIEAAIDLYRRNGATCLLSVTEAEHHPYKCFERREGALEPLFGVSQLSRPRQALPRTYRQNGAIYLLRTDLFQRYRAFFVPPVIPFVMPAERSVDVDSPLDWMLCEALLRRQ